MAASPLAWAVATTLPTESARAALPAEMPERGGGRDPIEPGAVARGAAERVPIAVGEEQRLLGDVLGIIGAADDAAGDGVDEAAIGGLEADRFFGRAGRRNGQSGHIGQYER